MKHWKLELMVDEHGAPRQATVVTYQDQEQVGVTTKSIEPFVSWAEIMNELLDSLPVQLRLL